MPCQSWSLGNYVALLSNKSSCLDISEEDVNHVRTTLTQCAPFYHGLMLEATCYEATLDYAAGSQCNEIPMQCKIHNAVYQILHFLTDIEFMQVYSSVTNTNLTNAMTLIPIAAGSASLELYRSFEHVTLQDDHTKVVAINFGIKHAMFDFYLTQDTLWFVIAVAVIFVLVWLYTTSVFLTIMTVVAMFVAVEISYFVYTMVFKIKFFPFMNLLTIILLIGIGVDDGLIYVRVWALAKLEKNIGTLEKIVSDTLRHASLSMFVTSFTTSAALYANYVSHITALECFAVYAGTTLLINFVLMITLLPAVIVIYEKWCSDCLFCYSWDVYNAKKGVCFYLCKIPYKVYYLISDWSRIFFEKILPCLVIRLRFLWLLTYGCLSVGGMVTVLYYPKLKLPTSNEFQVFGENHPFEVYDFQIKDRFWFEKAAGINNPTMPLTMVWGVEAVDNGDHMDPFSEGSLVYDVTFNVATPEAQEWLLNFCQGLRGTDLYQLSYGPQISNCFIEHFKRFMERSCEGPDREQLQPCCRESPFPYSESTFQKCMAKYRPLLAQSSQLYFSGTLAGPRYSKETGNMVALIVEFGSKQPFSFNYQEMDQFYHRANSWVSRQIAAAPAEMRNGWFTSHLEFYDLQETIAQGTPIAIGVAIAIATVVAFLTTLNILVTVFAMVSIAGTIFVTIGALVLLGWQLNILEAVTISVAVGLSIDFTLHYGMAYRLAPDYDREMRVVCSLSRMGSPVAMATLSTFIAGAVMLPSTVLAYQQLGIFLMLVMSVSWAFSTFFFQSLLRTFGPEGGFGQFSWPVSDCCLGGERDHVDKTIYAMSESTLSSSSNNHAPPSDTHELEPLTEHEPPSKYRHRPLQPIISNGSTGSSSSNGCVKDTIVTIRPNNIQKPLVHVSADVKPDEPCTERLLSISSEGTPDTPPMAVWSSEQEHSGLSARLQ